ncbi:MAG TPA: prephenate dehydratase [Burkholderiales bacterium]|jgi:chorismate mutase/prephenate dehydratase|nr:prephenate dehydratase [Burkholderiales bacterium]
MNDKLKKLREKIDALDARLVMLLSQRARLAQQVGHVKQGAAVYRPEREAQVLRRVAELNPGPLPDGALQRVYTEIMSACRALEDKMSVAFLGPEGTYSQEAALKHFGGMVPVVPCGSIDEVFRAVEIEAVGYGVVPVENSTEGAVGRTLDLLLSTPARVCGEVMLPIRQCLMSKGRKLSAIKKVYSHTQSLAQCQHWLTRHLPHAETVPVVSNAEAARLAARERGTAAIASATAAALYGLQLLARNIEDEAKNTTRFLVMASHDAAPSGKDRTSLILATRNVPGAIHALLTPLAANGVSMSRLESRPARTGLWEYVFYVDIEGHARDANVARALAELERKASLFKNLGSYPAAAA